MNVSRATTGLFLAAIALTGLMAGCSIPNDPKKLDPSDTSEAGLNKYEVSRSSLGAEWVSLGKSPSDQRELLISRNKNKLAITFQDGKTTVIDASPNLIEIQKSAPDRPSGSNNGERNAVARYSENKIEQCIENAKKRSTLAPGDIKYDDYHRIYEKCGQDVWDNSGTISITTGRKSYIIDAVVDQVFVFAGDGVDE